MWNFYDTIFGFIIITRKDGFKHTDLDRSTFYRMYRKRGLFEIILQLSEKRVPFKFQLASI